MVPPVVAPAPPAVGGEAEFDNWPAPKGDPGIAEDAGAAFAELAVAWDGFPVPPRLDEAITALLPEKVMV